METLQIPAHLRKNFVDVCRQLQLDADRVLEQLLAHFVAQPPEQSVEAWARKFLGNLTLADHDKLVDGLTVSDYFALAEEQRDTLWEKWEQEAEQALERMTARKVAVNANTLG